MSQLAMLLQESVDSAGRLTILGLLRERMDGSDLRIRKRKSFTERMGLKGFGCCGGPIWGFPQNTITVDDDEDDAADEGAEQGGDSEIHHQLPQQGPEDAARPGNDPIRSESEPACAADSPTPASASMNLAAALAVERQYRATHEPDAAGAADAGGDNVGTAAPGTQFRVSLMRLLEEADGGDDELAAAGGGGAGSDSVCCVCMGRKKGAAFIPCGHTYCRVCSRELWLNRGSCPLCNRPILEILDIF